MNLPPQNAALEQRLAQALDGCALGRPCLAFDSLPSTMEVAHHLALEGAQEGTVVLAEAQTAGRGRAGRAWVSPPGGLYASFILHPSRVLRDVPQLALLAGLAVTQAIQDLTTLAATVHWPNDVFLRGRKVAGILCETKAHDNKTTAIIGIGINAATEPKLLPREAISLAEVSRPPDRVALFAALCRHLDALYRQWNEHGFAPLKPTLARAMVFGNIVRITAGTDAFQGQAQDVDDHGRFLVRLDSGILRAVDVGEVTLLR